MNTSALMQAGPINEFLGMAVEGPLFGQLEVEVGRTERRLAPLQTDRISRERSLLALDRPRPAAKEQPGAPGLTIGLLQGNPTVQ